MQTYFTFPDGALAYDCAACGQACCRGKGMALDARELVPLLVKEPALSALVTTAPGGLSGWADVTDGCWFLEPDGFCRIETTRGRAAKPTTCQLFPFNRVFKVGDVRVVDFNSVICPLFDAEASGRRGVTHRELLDDLARFPDGPLTSSQAPLPAGADARWLPLERAILEASRRHLSQPADELAAFAEDAAHRALKRPADLDASRARMRGLERAWEAFFGVAPDVEAEAVARGRALALVTPSLRFNTLFRRGGPSWASAILRLPRLLLATDFLARAASALAPRTSLRSWTELHQNSAFTRELMSRFDEPAVVAAPFAIDAPEPLGSALAAAARALSPFRGPPRPLGELLAETWQPLPPPLRAAALGALARSGAELRFAEG